MTEKETMKQSADAANAESLTERARRLLQEAQDLLEQVRQREQARPLTAEELEQRMEPMLATMVALAQLDLSHLEQATEATTEAAQRVGRLGYDLERASERAEAASVTFRETLFQQMGWQAILCVLAGLFGAGLLAALLSYGVGLQQPAVYLDCQRVQQHLQQQHQAPSLPRR